MHIFSDFIFFSIGEVIFIILKKKKKKAFLTYCKTEPHNFYCKIIASFNKTMEGHLHLGSKEVVLAPSGTYFARATLCTGDGNKRKDENRREEGRWDEKGGLMEILCL